MGKWLLINGQAIYDSQPWIYQNDTITPNVWYTSSSSVRTERRNVFAIVLEYPYDSNTCEKCTSLAVGRYLGDNILFEETCFSMLSVDHCPPRTKLKDALADLLKKAEVTITNNLVDNSTRKRRQVPSSEPEVNEELYAEFMEANNEYIASQGDRLTYNEYKRLDAFLDAYRNHFITKGFFDEKPKKACKKTKDDEMQNDSPADTVNQLKSKHPNGLINKIGSISKSAFEFLGTNDADQLGKNTINNAAHQVHSRRKRGWFNGVGTAAKAVFGVMDEDDANKLEAEIQGVIKDNRKLRGMLQNQTSIQEITQNILKREEAGLHKQLGKMQAELAVLQAKDSLHKSDVFHTLAIQALTVIDNYREIQRAIIDLVIQIHHGKLSSILITPKQLKAQLDVIADNIPKQLMVPGFHDHEEDLANLYAIMRAQVRVTGTQLIIRINIPLLNREFLTLYHAIPVPFPHNGVIKTIVQQKRYIGVTSKMDHYYILSNEEKAECNSFSDNLLIVNSSNHCIIHKVAKHKVNNKSSFGNCNSFVKQTVKPKTLKVHCSNSRNKLGTILCLQISLCNFDCNYKVIIMPPSRLDGLYRRMLITKFFEKGWGKPENLQSEERVMFWYKSKKCQKI